jgi:hypothetical protein
MTTARIAPQGMAGWPEHWQRPSQADLDIVALAYARGLVLPHDPVLRRRAGPLPIGSAEVREITEQLYEAARREHGDTHRPLAGIAAPQIGIPARGLPVRPAGVRHRPAGAGRVDLRREPRGPAGGRRRPGVVAGRVPIHRERARLGPARPAHPADRIHAGR